MRLRFTPRAVADLISIADYLRERNPQAALSVRAAILDSLRLLLQFPNWVAISRSRACANS
jgi:plasmid stabilization system protein ParE